MTGEYVLDAAGEAVLTAYVHHVLETVEQMEKAVRIESAKVAGAHPAISQDPLAQLRLTPVAGHLLGRADINLPDFVGTELLAVAVADRDVHSRLWPACGAQPSCRAGEYVGRGQY